MKFKTFEEFSLNESSNTVSEEEIAKYRQEETKKIDEMQSAEEVEKWIFDITFGHHFPLNPVDPIRTSLRNKINELATEENHIGRYLTILEGEWKEIILPPGAMY